MLRFWTFFPWNQIWRWIYKLANMLFSVKSYQIIFFLHCPIFTLNEIWRKIMGVVCVFTTFSEKFLVNSSKFLKESARIPFTLNDHFTPDGGLKLSFGKTNQFHVKIIKKKSWKQCVNLRHFLPLRFYVKLALGNWKH